jgi:hypothetical protein
MEQKFVTRQEMAAEFGLSRKAFMKKIIKYAIELDERERISPVQQRKIRELILGIQTVNQLQLQSDHKGTR